MHSFVAILAMLLTQTASPQAPANPEAKAKAQALLKQGSALFEQGDYQSALDKFEAAYAVFASPKLQFNIAQADRSLGRPVEALKAYEQFVTLATDASADALEDARRSIAELRNKLGQLKIDSSPADSTVTVDGKSVGTTPLVWAVPGYHQVTIQHQQFAPAIESVEIFAGKVQTLTVKLRPTAVAAAAPVALSAPEPAATPEMTLTKRADESTRRVVRSDYFWGGVATTGVLGVATIVAGLMTNSHYDDLQNTCAHTTVGCSESQIDGVKTRAHVTNILLGLTAAAAVATGVVFYIDNRETGALFSHSF